jgi:hypothetical protein
MILLSENKDFEYWCIPVPKEATDIKEGRCSAITYNIGSKEEVIWLEWLIYNRLDDEMEILGVVGEPLSEDQAREVIDAYFENGYPNGHKYNNLSDLAYIIESKGMKEELKKVIIKVKK